MSGTTIRAWKRDPWLVIVDIVEQFFQKRARRCASFGLTDQCHHRSHYQVGHWAGAEFQHLFRGVSAGRLELAASVYSGYGYSSGPGVATGLMGMTGQPVAA